MPEEYQSLNCEAEDVLMYSPIQSWLHLSQMDDLGEQIP